MEQDTIEATIGDGCYPYGVRKRRSWGPPLGSDPWSIPLSVYDCPESCGADFSGPCGVAQSTRVGAGGLLAHGGLPERGNLRLGAADATGSSLGSGQHRRRISSGLRVTPWIYAIRRLWALHPSRTRPSDIPLHPRVNSPAAAPVADRDRRWLPSHITLVRCTPSGSSLRSYLSDCGSGPP